METGSEIPAQSDRLIDKLDLENVTYQDLINLSNQYLDEIKQIELNIQEDRSPEQQIELSKEYHNKLGIIETNNLWNYFKIRSDDDEGIMAQVYGIDKIDNRQRPEIQILKNLRDNDPDLFEDTQEIATSYNEIILNAANIPNAQILLTAVYWKLGLQMTQVAQKLKELGVADEDIILLYV